MKLIIRNLKAILYKFKMATLLNISGLSIAFAAFIIILMYVRFEYSYESYHPDADRIYRIDLLYPAGGSGWTQVRPLIDAVIQSSPYVETGTLLNPYIQDIYITVGENEDRKGFKEKIYSCYPQITELFHFSMLEGDKNSLHTAGKVLIPESMAKKMFGDQPATGQLLFVDSRIWTISVDNFFVIGGVYKDFPDNTQIRNGIYTLIDNDYTVNDWMSQNFFGYVLLDKHVSAEKVVDEFNNSFDFSKLSDPGVLLKLVPVKDIYFYNIYEDPDYVKTGSKTNAGILLLIAFLVVLIAAVNYTIFSTSLAPLRIKSINTQKILGGTEQTIRFVLLGEAVLISFLSFLFSLVFIRLFDISGSMTFIPVPLTLHSHIPLLLFTGLLALVIGAIAGLYPSYYMTSFSPVVALKGRNGLSPAGRRLRTVLVCLQFVVSFVLIISSLFIHQQNKYLFRYNPGFDTAQIAVVELNDRFYFNNREVWQNNLKEFPGIEDVAFAGCKLGGEETYTHYTGIYSDKKVGFDYLSVSWNFPEMMNIQLTAGEIREEYEHTPNIYLIPNRYMQEKHALELGDKIQFPFWSSDLIITAFAEDFNAKSLHHAMEDVCLVINDRNGAKSYSYIKIKPGTDIQQAVNHIRKTVRTLDPAYPFSIEFYDTIFQAVYKKESDVSKMIFLFSLLAILIALVGVFGLVIFETYYHYKEIGIRKIHGAGIAGIVWSFNRYYIGLVAVSFFIAMPIAWYGMSEWLKGFAYRTPLYWWVYAIAFLIILLLTVSTVTFQCWKAANSNPVESIKTE